MRRKQWSLLILVFAVAGTASGNEKDARAIIERAIRAHGGADALNRTLQCRRTDTGKQALATGETPFVSQVSCSLPDRVRLEIDLDKGKIKTTLGLDGDRGWQREGRSPAVLLPPSRVKELREEAYVWWLAALTPLLKDGFTLSTVPEIKVDGEAAVGVKVVRKGHADTRMYFLKRNGLLVRIDRRTPEAGLEVRKEYLYSDFKEFSGVTLPSKAIVKVNNRKWTEYTISNYKFPSKINASEFKKP